MTEGTAVEYGRGLYGVVLADYGDGERVWIRMDIYDPHQYPDGLRVVYKKDIKVIK